MTDTRVFEVAQLYADGLKQREIADKLGVSRTRVRELLKTAQRMARESHYIRRSLSRGDEIKNARAN